jgi:hypothetical protein
VIQWDEIMMDILAVVLIAVGVGLWFPPAGLIVAGVGVMVLSIGLKARRGNLPSRDYIAREVDE